MEEQRKRVRASDITERFAAALLIPGVLAERLRELNDAHLGQVLEHTIPIYDRETGAAQPASLFVAALGASSYTFAHATLSQDLSHWIQCHVLAFEFFQGTSQLIVPDNPRTGVNRACRYEPDLNRTYHELAMHYGVAVLPTRPYKPRDKAKVETAVQIVQRWIVAALRHRKFFSLAELNQAIRELLAKLNQRPFRKRPVPCQLYSELDRPALGPLPAERYELASGRQHASTSTTTSRSTSTTTACPTS